MHWKRYCSAINQLEELLDFKTAVVGHIEAFTAIIIDYDKLETHEIFAILIIFFLHIDREINILSLYLVELDKLSYHWLDRHSFLVFHSQRI